VRISTLSPCCEAPGTAVRTVDRGSCDSLQFANAAGQQRSYRFWAYSEPCCDFVILERVHPQQDYLFLTLGEDPKQPLDVAVLLRPAQQKDVAGREGLQDLGRLQLLAVTPLIAEVLADLLADYT
jgi:hypothetical protein